VELTNLVRFRGPNDSGFATFSLRSGVVADSHMFDMFLGSRRLSILDLSTAGHQPMSDGKGRWIVFNGEIFNFVELRQELQDRGHRFLTGTDTEVILHVYDEYGEQGFSKFNGMWAFAIVDLTRRAVILSRDRFSIKPLYLAEPGKGRIFFASEIKQLSPLLERTEVDGKVMSSFLSQGLLDHSLDTFYRQIRRLPAKTNLVISLQHDAFSYSQYWDFGQGSANQSTGSLDEFRELLVDSTRIRLRSDVPVGLLLSGGLDSSSLAAACTRITEQRVRAFSIVSGQAGANEEPYIDAVTSRLHLESHKLPIGDQDVRDGLEEVLYHNDEPYSGLSAVAQFKILQAVKNHGGAVVLLSGQGGDEVLLGYLKFFFFNLRELARTHRYGTLLAEFFASLMKGTVVRQFSLTSAKRYIPALREKGLPYLRGQQAPEPVWHCTDMRQRQILDINKYSVPALTHYEDRNAGAHSLEIRHPFLDHRLVNFALNLPTERKLSGGWTKVILRECFPELPSSIRWQRRKGYFSVPDEHWLRYDLRDLVRTSFKTSVLHEMGFIDKNLFLRSYEVFLDGRSLMGAVDISRTLIAELWAKKFAGKTQSGPSAAMGMESLISHIAN